MRELRVGVWFEGSCEIVYGLGFRCKEAMKQWQLQVMEEKRRGAIPNWEEVYGGVLNMSLGGF